MERLSQELIFRIASFLERSEDQSDIPLGLREKTQSKLPPYATLSREWQYAIESRTFRIIRLKSPELPYFSQVLTGHRRAFLSYLAYDVVLPAYGENECAKFETQKDRGDNSRAFTHAMHSLFQVLKSWEGVASEEDHWKDRATAIQPRSIQLDLSDVYSPMDGIHRGREKFEEDREQHDLGKRHDLWEHRYEHSFLQLLESPSLPTLSQVSSFRVYAHYPRRVEPRSAVLLASKLKNLECINWDLSDNEKKDPHLQQQSRYDFARALLLLAQASLKTFSLSFYHESPCNHHFSPPSAFLPSSPSTDHLSCALHTLSQSSKLTSLQLGGPIVISPELYWPADSSTRPSWPNLRHFHVEFDMTTPDGDWYFTRDPTKPEDDDDSDNDDDVEGEAEAAADSSSEDDTSTTSSDSFRPDSFDERKEARAVGDFPIRMFRTLPSDSKINSLLLAMARAAGHMPQLQTMSLVSKLRGADGAGFEIHYHAPGQRSHLDSELGDGEKARLYWAVGKWRPEEEVLRIWRAGREEMKVKFFECLGPPPHKFGYWDSIVIKAASRKRKRSLKDVGGNHKRWLEEEWRDDIHLKGLSRKELHARWFGSDVISWLRGLLNTNIKPEFTHEIDTTFTAKLIDETWGPCKVGGAKVDVVADGWVRLKAAAGVSSSGNCPFTYGIDVGADLFATVSAPSAFGWTPRSFPIAALPAKAAKEGGACPTKQKRSIYEALLEPTTEYGAIGNRSRHALVKRAPVVGPLLTLPKSCFFCPQPEPSTTDCASITGWEPAQLTDPDAISKRGFSSNVHYNYFEKRAPKNIRFCTPPIQAKSPRFDSSGNIISSVPNIATYGYTNPLDCNDFGFGLVGVPVRGQNSDKFATEHILEFQWLTIFLDELRSRQGNIYTALKDGISKVGLCQHLEDYWDPPPVRWITINGIRRSPLQWVSYQFPGSDSDYNSEFVLLDSGVNAAKVGMWGKTAINSDETMTDYEQQQPDRAVKNIKDVLSAYKYHQIQAVNDILVRQANRVGAMFGRMENGYLANNYPGYEKIGLQTLWTSWIKGRTDRARARAETYMKDGVKRLHDGYGSDYNRQFTNPVLLAKIDSLTTAVNSQQGWANPF